MKLSKRMAGVSLAAIMILTAAVPAVSAAATDITDKVTNDHTYEIYQIFSGTQTEAGDQNLSDIKWANGVNSTSLLADFNAAYSQSFTEAKEVAKYIAENLSTEDDARGVAILVNNNLSNTKTTITAQPDDYTLSDAGYYLIVDTTDVAGKEDDSKNLILLRFTNTKDTETLVTIEGITNKTDVPELEKKVQEESYMANNETGDTGFTLGDGYNDVADYDIGDDVPFELIGTLPTNYSSYTLYKYVFHDTACAGLDDPQNVVVSLCKADGTVVKTITEYFTVDTNDKTDGCTFEVACKDLTAIEGVTADSYIVVNYTAKLNEKAEIGLPGNENEAKLEYSNNPNVVYEIVTGTDGKPVYEEDGVTPQKKPVPNPSKEEDTTGFTPVDKVIVFTYQLDLIKVDSDDNETKLAGATFALKNSDGEYYKFTAATTTTAAKVEWVDDVASATTMTTGADGKISFVGIDASVLTDNTAVYYLEETESPKGYSKLTEDIEVTLTAETVNCQTWTTTPDAALKSASCGVVDPNGLFVAGSNKVTNFGVFEFTEANEKGVKLPGTGGMGTAVFYITGSILVAAAGVLLIAKKRANSSK